MPACGEKLIKKLAWVTPNPVYPWGGRLCMEKSQLIPEPTQKGCLFVLAFSPSLLPQYKIKAKFPSVCFSDGHCNRCTDLHQTWSDATSYGRQEVLGDLEACGQGEVQRQGVRQTEERRSFACSDRLKNFPIFFLEEIGRMC